MPRLILYIVLVAVLVAAAVWFANDPGAVSLTWHGWQVETSVGILIAALIAVVIVIFLILRVLAVIGGSVQAFAAARRERRFKRGLARLGDGFAAVQAGQRHAAQRLAREAAALLSDNPAVLMLRKEAAALSGDTREVQAAARAMLTRPETELAGLKTLATKSIADGDIVGAVTQARRALAHKDPPAWALSMVLDMEITMEHWPEALEALDRPVAREAFSPGEVKRLRSRLLTLQAQRALGHGDAVGGANAAKKAMEVDDTNHAAVAIFARAMAAQGKGRKAAGAVERAWAVKPGADLLTAYRNLAPGESALDFARRIDGLAKAAPDHPESRLAVAAASLEAGLWGQTRNRLAGLTGDDTPAELRARAAHLLADVESLERGDTEKAAVWLQVALDARREVTRSTAKPKSVADVLALEAR